MSDKLRFVLVLGAAWSFVLAAVTGAALLVAAEVSEPQRVLLASILRERAATVVVAALLLLAALALVGRALWQRHVDAPRQLAEDARIMLVANPAHRAPARGSAEIVALAAAFNGFA